MTSLARSRIRTESKVTGRIVVLGLLVSLGLPRAHGAARTRDGLQALYDFRSSSGEIVKDCSGVGLPLDLRITSPEAVRRAEGSLEVRGKTLIRSEKPASKITDAVRQSGEFTIEAWIRAADANQNGPARIVTLSRDPNERNVTLGQDGNRFDARFRTSQTSANGIPSLSSASRSVTAELTHVVYTRDRIGRAQIFVNGNQSVELTIPGATSNWDGSFRLALANELTSDRPWLGTYHLVAIYSRKLSSPEIQGNFKAGVDAPAAPARLAEKRTSPEPKAAANAAGARHFDAQIAPLL